MCPAVERVNHTCLVTLAATPREGKDSFLPRADRPESDTFTPVGRGYSTGPAGLKNTQAPRREGFVPPMSPSPLLGHRLPPLPETWGRRCGGPRTRTLPVRRVSGSPGSVWSSGLGWGRSLSLTHAHAVAQANASALYWARRRLAVPMGTLAGAPGRRGPVGGLLEAATLAAFPGRPGQRRRTPFALPLGEGPSGIPLLPVACHWLASGGRAFSLALGASPGGGVRRSPHGDGPGWTDVATLPPTPHPRFHGHGGGDLGRPVVPSRSGSGWRGRVPPILACRGQPSRRLAGRRGLFALVRRPVFGSSGRVGLRASGSGRCRTVRTAPVRP